MLVKVIIFFLAAMVLVALVGRVLFPSALPHVMRKRSKTPVCKQCGRYLVDRKECGCGGKAK